MLKFSKKHFSQKTSFGEGKWRIFWPAWATDWPEWPSAPSKKSCVEIFWMGWNPHLTSGQVPGEVVAFFSPCPLTPTISFFLFPHPLPPSFFLLPLSHSPISFLTFLFSSFLYFFFHFLVLLLLLFYFICYVFFAMFSLFVRFCVCSSYVCVKEEKLYHNKTLLGRIMFF